MRKFGINLKIFRIILWQTLFLFPFRFSSQFIILCWNKKADLFFSQFCKFFSFIMIRVIIFWYWPETMKLINIFSMCTTSRLARKQEINSGGEDETQLIFLHICLRWACNLLSWLNPFSSKTSGAISLVIYPIGGLGYSY